MSKTSVEKAAVSVQKLASITVHPYLPSFEDQIEAARAWGISEASFEELDVSPIWVDDVSKVKTTYWPSRLPQRNDLLNAFRLHQLPDHTVFFANPLCVGFSKAHAQSVIDVIFGSGAAMYVDDLGREYRSGKQLAAFWKEHSRQLKNAQMTKYRRAR